MPRRIESHWIAGPAGRLEAILEAAESDGAAPRSLAVVCHPHPLYGGTMHNKVVYRIARALRRAGAAVLRFNFRGVGASEGEHAHGTGELEDARAALDWLRGRYPGLPYTLAGFSFGSRIAARLGCQIAAARIIAVGFPTKPDTGEHLESCAVPKLFVQSTHDQYGPRAELEELFARVAEPKRLIWIEARDHFFEAGLDELEEAVLRS